MLFGKKRNQFKTELLDVNVNNSSIIYYRENGMKKALSGNKSLSKEEEQELIRKYKEEGDEKAKEKLILCNIPFVISLIKKYKPINFDSQFYNELLQEGIYGLCKALDTFDLNNKNNVRFYSYAAVSVNRYLSLYAKERSSSIRIPIRTLNKIEKIISDKKDKPEEITKKEKKLLEDYKVLHPVSIDTRIVERDKEYFYESDNIEPRNYKEYYYAFRYNTETNTDDIRHEIIKIDNLMLEVKLTILFKECGIPDYIILYLILYKMILKTINLEEVAQIYNTTKEELNKRYLENHKKITEKKISKMFYQKIQNSPDKEKIKKIIELLTVGRYE